LKEKIFDSSLRIQILTILSLRGSITFTELKKLLSVSDGNLSVHLKKLEDADFITVEKKFEGRKPQTTYKLTELGKKEFIEYLNNMEVVLKKLKETNNSSKS
jgi:DNA-binding MarR family transcriptional regulator